MAVKVTNGRVEHLPPPSQEKVDEMFQEYVLNAMSMRKQWFDRMSDPRRNLYKEAGYPDTEFIGWETYQHLFNREGIAKRVVEAWPKECWQVNPCVYEDEDSEVQTPFEEDWDMIAQTLDREDPDPMGGLQDTEGAVLWNYLRRLDIQSGIGQYGVLLLGFDDGAPLDQPVKGISEQNSLGASFTQVDNEDGSRTKQWKQPSLDGLKVYRLINNAAPGKRKLLYLRVFQEQLADIIEIERNPTSQRYGKPVRYRLSFNDPSAGQSSTAGITQQSITVHWTRIIHFTDDPTSSEVYGVPRMQQVLNDILGVQKVKVSAPEMFYKGAFQGLFFGTDPSLGGKVAIDKDQFKDSIENFQNGLQRYLYANGLTVQQLAPNVADPTGQLTILLQAIAIAIDMPMRIFMGSERGELASGQDEDTWSDRVRAREQNILTPRMISPLVTRLILVGVCRRPTEGFYVKWPDIAKQSREQKAGVALQETQAISAYVTAGADALVPPMEFFTQVLGWDDEAAQQVMDAARAQLDTTEGDTKSPLLSMVGGITGMVQLWTLAGQGMVSQDQLKELIMLFYKVPEAIADQLIADGLTTTAIQAGEPPPPPETPPVPIKVNPGQGLVNPDGSHLLSPAPMPTGNQLVLDFNTGMFIENAKLTGGSWVTTEDGNHVYIKGGKPVAGNPNVLEKMKDSGSGQHSAKEPKSAPKKVGKEETSDGTKKHQPISKTDTTEVKSPKVSKDEAKAFKDYSEEHAFDINSSLRDGEALTGRDKEIATHLSKVIQSKGELQHPVDVYRSMSWSHQSDFNAFLSQATEGKTLQMKGFQSTSLDQEFVDKNFGYRPGGSVMLKITANKGVRMTGDMTHHEGQKEFLLDHNSQFKILKVHSQGGKTVIHMEQLK